MNDNYITLTIGKKKNIALIAHDNKKADLIEWCEQNKDILTQHFLCGTGTTARMITDKTGLPVKGYNSGPLGGDQQIGAKIVEGRIDFVVFFSDPLTAQPHDPDVKALLRIAQVYDIPIANNRASADFMIHSEFMNEEYEHERAKIQRNMNSEEFKNYARLRNGVETVPSNIRRNYHLEKIPRMNFSRCYRNRSKVLYGFDPNIILM